MRWLQAHGTGIQEMELDFQWQELPDCAIRLLANLPNVKFLKIGNWLPNGKRYLQEAGPILFLRSLSNLQMLDLEVLDDAVYLLEPLGRLAGLQSLALRDACCSLLLPFSLSKLTQLTNLQLHSIMHCPYADEVAVRIIQHLINLQALCSHAVLSSIPERFKNLTALRCLSLSGFSNEQCFLRVPQDMAWCALTHLSLHDVPGPYGWALAPLLATLAQIGTLLELDFGYGADEEHSGKDWSFSPRLTRLTLRLCDLNAIPNAIISMTSLRHLDLGENLTMDLPDGPYLQRLEHLVIDIDSFTRPPHVLLQAHSLRDVTFGVAFGDDEQLCKEFEPFVIQMGRDNPACRVICLWK